MSFKSLIMIVLAVVAIAALGWVSFQKSDTEANITIDTQEIKDDTNKAIEKGKELIDDAKDAIDDSTTDDTDDKPESSPLDKPSDTNAEGDSPVSSGDEEVPEQP